MVSKKVLSHLLYYMLMFGVLHFCNWSAFFFFLKNATRCTQVYLTQTCDKLPMIFENFHKMAVIEIGVKILLLLSDKSIDHFWQQIG